MREPVDVVAVVRAPDWDVWAAWLAGEDPEEAVAGLTPGKRAVWDGWTGKWRRMAKGRGPGARHALGSWDWVSCAPAARLVSPGSALYVVSRGRLRLRIPLDVGKSVPGSRAHDATGLQFERTCHGCARRCGCPVAIEPVTLDQDVPSPRGMRRRWWPREIERPCPDWRGRALGLEGDQS